jgi:hypothetical protein
MAAAPLHKLLILEGSMLASMATNPNFIREFPFLKTIQQPGARTGCGRCGQKANKRIQSANAVKQQIVSMGKEKKVRLKKLLRAEKVRIRLAANGKVTEYTF